MPIPEPKWKTELKDKLDAIYFKGTHPDDGTPDPFKAAGATLNDATFNYNKPKILLTPFTEGYQVHYLVQEPSWVRDEDNNPLQGTALDERNAAITAAIENYFTEKGFVNTRTPLDEPSVKRIVTARLAPLIKDRPEYTLVEHRSSPSEKPFLLGGVYNATIPKPNAINNPNHNIMLNFEITSPEDYLRPKGSFMQHKAIQIQISAQTRDPRIAERLMVAAKEALKDNFGMYDFDLKAVERGDTGNVPIPLEWIDSDKIRPDTLSGNQRSYNIIVVPASAGPGRVIAFSARTDDYDRAEAMAACAAKYVNSFREGGENYEKPITRNGIRDHVLKAFPALIQRPSHPWKTKPLVDIAIGGEVKMRVVEPRLVEPVRPGANFGAALLFKPALTAHATQHITKEMTRDLNTTTRELAVTRLYDMNTIAILKLRDYFTKNSKRRIETTDKVRGASVDHSFSKPEVNSNKLFFDDIRKEIVSALDEYKRYVHWDTHIAEVEDGVWEVSFRPKRNKEATTENLAATIPYSEESKVRFDSKDEAENFTQTLESELLGKEFILIQAEQDTAKAQEAIDANYHSKERPVEFTDSVIAGVIKGSLKVALNKFPEVDTRGKSTLSSLIDKQSLLAIGGNRLDVDD